MIGRGLPRKEGKEEDDDTKLLTEKLLKSTLTKVGYRWRFSSNDGFGDYPAQFNLDSPQREFEMLFKSQIQNPKLQINSNDQIFEIQNEVYAMAKNINV